MKTLDFTALPTIPLRPIFAPEAKIVAELSQDYPACRKTPVSLAERFNF
jgi:hypothetical protein